MRAPKRFSKQILDLFTGEKRGSGILSEYLPWHQVSRSDPSSRGRSHWHLSPLARHHHLLSDLERCCLLLILALPNVHDCLEQFPLPTRSEPHVLGRYGLSSPLQLYPGTEQISNELHIRHPRLTKETDGELWQMTTDFLVFCDVDNDLRPLAVSVKPDKPLTKRQKELLSIEKAYWNRCGVNWLLFTPSLLHPQVKLNLEKIACWLTPTHPKQMLIRAAERVLSDHNKSLTQVLVMLANNSDANTGFDSAQRLFWQSVYYGLIPLDLRIPIRPTQRLTLISTTSYQNLNPIATGRTAWI